MSFRLKTILWVVAVVGAAMATFGVGGVVVATIAIGAWACIFASGMCRPQVDRLLVVATAIVLGLIVIALLLAAVTTPAEAARRSQCLSQIKQLALALHLYHDAHNEFPPAHLTNAAGHQTLSWRVLVLPFIDEAALYNRFDLTRSWNAPPNVNLLPAQQLICTCPSNRQSSFDSNYFAVVAPDTFWPESRSLKKSEVTDGLSNTIALIEVHGKNVNWAEPHELNLSQAVKILSTKCTGDGGHSIKPSFFHREVVGRNIVFADGSGMFLVDPIDPVLADSLLTVNGGEDVEAELQRLRKRNYHLPLDYSAIYSMIAFIAIVLVPLTKVSRAVNPGQQS